MAASEQVLPGGECIHVIHKRCPIVGNVGNPGRQRQRSEAKIVCAGGMEPDVILCHFTVLLHLIRKLQLIVACPTAMGWSRG